MIPSANELIYFLEVSSSLNISRASERLGISQPSLSMAIKRLEEIIGTTLFVRHKHGVTLTQAGKQLLLHARHLLQYWDKTKANALRSHQEIQGHFTLGCNSPIATYALTGSLLSNLLEQYPKLEIHLKNDISRKITEEVINLSIDIGIVINPIKHLDLIIKHLGVDEFTFWVARGKKQIQNIHSDNAVILCNPHLLQTQSLLKKCNKLKMNFRRIMTMNSLEVVAHLTASGCGIGMLPARVANAMYGNKLKRVPDMPNYQDELCLIYRSENRNIEAIQTLIRAIMNHFECID